MFWQKVEGLKKLPVSSKAALTLFLCIAGIGYLLGFFNIYLSYSPVDQKPGLSIEDIRISFSGARGATAIDKAIDGAMRQYFASDAEYVKMKDWIKAGAKETEFSAVKGILESSCLSCHASQVKVGNVVLESYKDVSAFLTQDTGKSIPRLVSLSHTHVLATVTVLFLLCLVFSFTLFHEGVKTLVMVFSLSSIVVDIGTWWCAKFFAGLAPLVIVGGVLLAVSFLVLILLSLYDLWLRPDHP
jgi:hypothetical protein